jgi:integrase
MQQTLDGESRVPTLAQVWTDYRRTKKLKASTLSMYDERLNACFKDWLPLPITVLSKKAIEEKHQLITIQRGAGTANISLRILRALLNFAQVKYENPDGTPFLKSNPVLILSQVGAWNTDKTRERHIPADKLRDWYHAVRQIKSKDAQDFYLFLVMTGCRVSEAAKLEWQDVDLRQSQVIFRSTKNNKDHKLAVCRYLSQLLFRRYGKCGTDRYVFQARNGKPYHLHPGVQLRVSRLSGGVFVSPHDLRRTYATIAHAIGVDPMDIKRLLNHSITDVTWRYIIYNPERYRKEVELLGSGLTLLLGIDMPSLIERELPLIDWKIKP